MVLFDKVVGPSQGRVYVGKVDHCGAGLDSPASIPNHSVSWCGCGFTAQAPALPVAMASMSGGQ